MYYFHVVSYIVFRSCVFLNNNVLVYSFLPLQFDISYNLTGNGPFQYPQSQSQSQVQSKSPWVFQGNVNFGSGKPLVCTNGCCPCHSSPAHCPSCVCPHFPPIVNHFPPPTLWASCADDFHSDSSRQWNLVDAGKVVATLSNPYTACLNPLWQRVMLGNKTLAPFERSVQIGQAERTLYLNSGCMVQTITVNSLTHLTVQCLEVTSKCLVSIPCVVPRVLITYLYNQPGEASGTVVAEVKDEPMTLEVTLDRDIRGVCYVGEVDGRILSNYSIVYHFDRDNQFIKQITRKINNNKEWILEAYKDQINQFVFQVVNEAFVETTRLFLPVDELRRFCKIITEARSPIPSIPTRGPPSMTPEAHPTTHPTLPPTYYPTSNSLPQTCIDEYLHNRQNPFNVVNPTQTLKITGSNQCVSSGTPRVVIGDRQLSPTFQHSLIIDNLYLDNGCLVQSITVPYQAQISADCQSRADECVLTIPCVVPRVVVGYDYTYTSDIDSSRGTVIIELQNKPISIPVTVVRKENRICYLSTDIEEKLLSKYEVVLKVDNDSKVVVDVISKIINEDWLTPVFKAELREFTIRVIHEAFYQTKHFLPIDALLQFCEVLAPEASTKDSPYPSISPFTIKCSDDFSSDRTHPFNLVDTTEVYNKLNINGACLVPFKKLVMLQDLSLSNTFAPTTKYRDLRLTNGCLVQSTTANKDLQLTFECPTGSYQCQVTIPCVVPRVMITQTFTVENIQGEVIIDVHDKPIDLVLTITRDSNGKCTVLNELDDELLAKRRVYLFFADDRNQSYLPYVKQVLQELVHKGWTYYAYKEEVKEFLDKVFVEIFSRKYEIFSKTQQVRLKQYCKSVTLQPRLPPSKSTWELPSETPATPPTIYPTVYPKYYHTWEPTYTKPTRPPNVYPTVSPTHDSTWEPNYTKLVLPPKVYPTVPPTYDSTWEPTYTKPALPLNAYPTVSPTYYPTWDPTYTKPALHPKIYPTVPPKYNPTWEPTYTKPALPPKLYPTVPPTYDSTWEPTYTKPARPPNVYPTVSPTHDSTWDPTYTKPDLHPKIYPTVPPKYNPTWEPTYTKPALPPKVYPTVPPTYDSTWEPTYTKPALPLNAYTTVSPTYYPTWDPTYTKPALPPKIYPTVPPTYKPSWEPTYAKPALPPKIYPTVSPTYNPTWDSTYTKPALPQKIYPTLPQTWEPFSATPAYNASINPSVTPIYYPTSTSPPQTCVDEYLHNRQKPFNVVNPTQTLKITGSNQCVSSGTPRVVIGDRQLSPTFQHSLIIDNLYLDNGCLVQSITVPYQAQISADCQSRADECILTIPCVVPRVVVGYDYTYTSDIESSRGTVIIELQNKPISIPVTVVRKENRICYLSTDIEDKLLYQYEVKLTLDHDVKVISKMLYEQINRGWLYSTFKDQINEFTIRIGQEAFLQSNKVFATVETLWQFCDVIRPEVQTTGLPYPSITSPTIIKCTDDFSNDRRYPFNLVNTADVITKVNVTGDCLVSFKKRVMIQDLSLSNTFAPTTKYRDLRLTNGCLVQSTTANKDLQLTFECPTGSYQCQVTIPCVVPRVLTTHTFKVDNIQGAVIVDVHNEPIDLVLTITRDNIGQCTVLSEFGDELLARRKVRITYDVNNNQRQYLPQIKLLMQELVQRGWPNYAYKKEVKQFLNKVFMEIYQKKYKIFTKFPEINLIQYCKSVTIQPTLPEPVPTWESPFATPAEHPTMYPTDTPSYYPTWEPPFTTTEAPPTMYPTDTPSYYPTWELPSKTPAEHRTMYPTDTPSYYPTWEPPFTTTEAPPTMYPTVSPAWEPPPKTPAEHPTMYPTDTPSYYPTWEPPFTTPEAPPTTYPTDTPSYYPPRKPPPKTPAEHPTMYPTNAPSYYPPRKSPSMTPEAPPTTHPTVPPTYYPASTSLPQTCIDEYLHNRQNPFNVVDPTQTLKITGPNHCVSSGALRIVIGDRQLSSTFQPSQIIDNLYLGNGCLVQSTTVPYQAQITADCQSRAEECILTIPCVVPRVVVGYDYTYTSDIESSRGTVIIELQNKPISIPVTVVRKENRICYLSTDIEDKLLSQYEVKLTLDHDVKVINEMLHEQINRGWLYSTFKDQINEFAIRVVQETFSQASDVLPPLDKLWQFCDVIRPEASTTDSPYPSISPFTIKCSDDFSNDRTHPFNLVDTTEVYNKLNINGACLVPFKKRVMLQDLSLSNTFAPTTKYRDLRLTNGCMVQSTTANKDLQLTFECPTGSYQCQVTIPCVVPRVLITHAFTADNIQGVVNIDVHNEPIDLMLTIIRDSNGKCTVLNELDDELLAKRRVQITYDVYENQKQYLPQVKQALEELVQKGWPNYVYKEEVKQFLDKIFMETYKEQYGIFPSGQQLRIRQYCQSVTIQPSLPPVVPDWDLPTTTVPPRPPPPYPNLYKDEFADSRNYDFNVIDAKRILPFLSKPNECISSGEKRTLLGKGLAMQQLQGSHKVEELILNQGNVIQSVTVPYQVELSEDCSTRQDGCIITVPCVVPRIVLSYSFIYKTPEGDDYPGTVVVEVHDDPLDIPVLVSKSNSVTIHDTKILNDRTILKNLKVTLDVDHTDPDISQQAKNVLINYIQKTGWPFNIYVEEVKSVMKAIVNEAFQQTTNVIRPISSATARPTPDESSTSYPALCKDDFADSRHKAFNVIGTERIIPLLLKPSDCVREGEKRVLPGKGLYSHQLIETININGLSLNGGCLIQSVTVPYQVELSENCSSRQDGCIITVPCVVPRIVTSHSFVYKTPDGREHPGSLIVEVHDDPLDIPVLVTKSNSVSHRAMRILDERRILKNFKVTVNPDQTDPDISLQVKNLMVSHIQKTGWPFNIYVEEMNYTMIAIVNEAIQQTSKVIRYVDMAARTLPHSTNAPRKTSSDSAVSPQHTCRDDYPLNRSEEFNVISSPQPLKNLEHTPSCGSHETPRFLIGDSQLSQNFEKDVAFGDMFLSNGCLVQSITLPHQASLSADCQTDSGCVVSVPCVIPRIVMGYDYNYTSQGETFKGTVILELQDKPITVKVFISKDENGVCSVEKVNEEDLNSTYRLIISLDPKNKRVSDIIHNEINNNGWPLSTYIEEVRFAIARVIKEAFSQTSNVTRQNDQLQQFCKSIEIPPNPSKEIPNGTKDSVKLSNENEESPEKTTDQRYGNDNSSEKLSSEKRLVDSTTEKGKKEDFLHGPIQVEVTYAEDDK